MMAERQLPVAENEQNVGSRSEGQQPEGQPTREETVPMSSYKKLQRDLQERTDKVKAFEAKAREGEPVEAALAREREEKETLQKELKVERIKRAAPADTHDAIDNFVSKYGIVPDDDDLKMFSKPVTVAEQAQQAPTQQESSGVRNSPAGAAGKPNYDDPEYLRSIQVEL